jgi:hypothetical protein
MSIEKCIKCLGNNSLYFNSPNNFNDPFDCDVVVNGFQKNLRRFLHNINTEKKEQYAVFNKKNTNLEDLYQAVVEAKNNLGICCFTKDNSNLLMWAHYADNHKGVCLKFDIYEDKEIFDDPLTVKYSAYKPLLDANKLQDIDHIKNVFTTKSKHWKYEKEIRFMFNHKGLRKFKKASLKAIYLGYKLNDMDKEIIESLLFNGYNKTIKYKADVDEDNFKLIFNKLI